MKVNINLATNPRSLSALFFTKLLAIPLYYKENIVSKLQIAF